MVFYDNRFVCNFNSLSVKINSSQSYCFLSSNSHVVVALVNRLCWKFPSEACFCSCWWGS